MKRLIAILLTLVLVLACGSCAMAQEDTFKIVCTAFPQYDWVRQVLGDTIDGVQLTLLMDKGVDLHSYQPTAMDIAKISTADLFVYVGGESDGWVTDALANATNSDLIAVNLLTTLGDGVKEEELVEGMEAEEEETEESEEESPEYDEHVWLSLKNAAVLTGVLADALGTMDSAHQAIYAANAQAYIERLNALDAQYEQMVSTAARTTVLFADRFPFRYLADDYGLTYYAAFVGCSAESEASFATIAFLAEKTEELGLPVVLVLEGAQHNIAETVVASTTAKDQQILVVDSIQSVTADEVANGLTYLSIMQENLAVLTTALN